MASEDPERGGKINIGGSGAYGSHNSGYTTSSGYAIADDGERHWTSWLIPVVVVLNVAVFVVAMYVNDCPKHAAVGGSCVAGFLGRFSFQPTPENPLFGPSYSTLKKMGALEWRSVVARHQEWRLITCIWLHAGVIHLLANMLSLVFVGIRLEQQFGFVKVGIIYMVSGFGGSVLSSLFIQKSISVGASGALFGLLGAMLAELVTNWTIYTNKAAALLTLLFIIAINLAVGIFPHVNNFAHIGGVLTGLLLGFVLLPRPHLGWLSGVRVKSKYKAYQVVLWVLSLLLVIAGLAAGLVMLLRGKNGYDTCHWCRYLSCVPTSKWKCHD